MPKRRRRKARRPPRIPLYVRRAMNKRLRRLRSFRAAAKYTADQPPCPVNPFERTVELLDSNELDRECEITKILYLSSLGIVPGFARPAPEDSPVDNVGSLRTRCIQAHIKYLYKIKERNEQERRNKTVPNKVSTDDESGSSSRYSVSSLEVESTPSPNPSDPEFDDEEEWIDVGDLEHFKMKDSAESSSCDESPEEVLKDCVTKLLMRGNFVNFIGIDPPPFLQEIIRTLSPKVEESSEDDENHQWINWDERPNSPDIAAPIKDTRNKPLKKSLQNHIPAGRKGRSVNRIKKSKAHPLPRSRLPVP